MKPEEMEKYLIGVLKYKVIAWTVTIIFIVSFIIYWKHDELFPAVCCFFLVIFGLLMISIASHIKMDKKAIYVHSPFSEYRMLWNEIESVEIGSWMCVFHGSGNKRLVIPSAWSGKQKEMALEFMGKQIKLLKIGSTFNNFADYKIHKNVRVKNA